MKHRVMVASQAEHSSSAGFLGDLSAKQQQQKATAAGKQPHTMHIINSCYILTEDEGRYASFLQAGIARKADEVDCRAA
jgi:hypothetical protein